MTLAGPVRGLVGSAARPALRRCVAVSPAEFATVHFGRTPLLSRPPDGFADLFDVAAVDSLLGERGLRTPFLRVAKEGRVLPVDRYVGGGGAGAEVADQVLDEKVLALLGDGATLVLQGLHRLWPPLTRFAVGLREDLGHPVQINGYITPPGNRGFATHYDTHDVFVLQIAGRKRWRVHPPVVTDPLERQPWGGRADEVSAAADGPPFLDAQFAPGDALYLPRGWLHSAEAVDSLSVHLTIGVKSVTRHDVLGALLDLAVSEPSLRTGLPMGVDVGSSDDIAAELASTVDALRAWLSTVDPADVARILGARHRAAGRPAPLAPLAQLAAASSLDATTPVVLRAGLRPTLTESGDRVIMALYGRTLDFPGFCAPALERVLAGEPCGAADLPGLDAEDGVVLLRRLLREAAVTPL
jgi:lysine-specific demethylase/histidyl-hydroxylase NO66